MSSPIANPRPDPATTQLLTKLETLLRDKANEIHLAGQLGANLLAQQNELEARVRQIAELQVTTTSSPEPNSSRRNRVAGVATNGDLSSDGEDKALGEETKRRLEELEDELRKWDQGNQPLYQTVGIAAAQGLPDLTGTDSKKHSSASNDENVDVFGSTNGSGARKNTIPPSHSTTSSSSGLNDIASSRRARNNAQHRNNDIELATEIGQSLLGEVRRLQALLVEKEEQMRDGTKERDAIEAELENEKSSRRTVEESVEKYKEENWNLELVSQDLRTNFNESQASLQKAESERQRALRDLAMTRETLDTQRSEAEKLTQQLEAFKQKHETDMANMRKQTAGLQREKSDLQGTLEGLKTELATRARGIKRGGSTQGIDDLTSGDNSFDDNRREFEDEGDDGDVFRTGGRRKTGDGFPPASPGDLFSEYGDGSPVQRPGFISTPDNSLKSGLAHAQRTIATLRSSLAREKATKMELRRQLADNGIAWEDDDDESAHDGTPARSRTPASVRGSVRGSARGRGASSRRRGGAAVGVPSRLRSFAGDSSIDEEEEKSGQAMDAFDRASLFEHQFPSGDDEYSEIDSPIRNARDSMLDDATPLSDDDASIRSRRSSLRQATNLGDVLGNFGGNTSNRRESIASLASIADGSFRALSPEPVTTVMSPAKPQIVWSDASTMTEPLPEPTIPEPITVTVYVPEPKPASTEIAIQTDAWPVPEPKIVEVRVEVPVQVPVEVPVEVLLPAPVVDKKDASVSPMKIQTTEVGTSTDPVRSSEMQVQTDPLPQPGPVIVEQAVSPASAADMEDRALATQPSSLASLGIGKLFGGFGRSGSGGAPSIQRSVTSSTVGGFQTATEGAATEDENETETETETETEGESDFEDARETIGAPSPYAQSRHSHNESINTFISTRSGTANSFNTARTFGARATDESDAEDPIEILRTPLASRNGREWSAPVAVAVSKPIVVEVGVQTDAWVPQSALLDTPRPQTPARGLLEQGGRDRDSINTFGRAETPDDLEGSAARASAYMSGSNGPSTPGIDRAFSPDQSRPDSVVSTFSQGTTEAGSVPPLSPMAASMNEKSKLSQSQSTVTASKMGPPPTPSSRRGTSPGHTPSRGTAPRKSTISTASRSSLRAPPRPTSPPPPDLLYRAQSPAFDDDYSRRQTLLVPGPSVRNTPSRKSSLQNLRPQSSSANLPDRRSVGGKSRSSTISRVESRTAASVIPPLPTQSQHHQLASSARSISEMSVHSDMSRRPSMASSRTSDGGLFDARRDTDEAMRGGAGDSTDPAVIHAITQTMIGEFLHKYTRRTIGKGISEKRHKRFFWIHPYTKTLYWSTSDPGGVNTNQQSAKSVCIEGVRQVLDANPMPPGLHQGSIILQTPNREMKITASTRERHDMWFNAITYLLARPENSPETANSRRVNSAAPASPTTHSSRFHNGQHEYSLTPNAKMYNLGGSQSESRLTPKNRGGANATGSVSHKKAAATTFGSTYKRQGTPANDYQRYTEFGSPRSVRTYSFQGDETIEFIDRREMPAELGDDEDETWEGLENVRACCDGKHDVGSLSRRGGPNAHHHHQHHHHHHSQQSQKRSGRVSESESVSMPVTPQRLRSKSALGTVGSSFSKRFNSSSTSIPSPARRSEISAGPPMLGAPKPLAPLSMNT